MLAGASPHARADNLANLLIVEAAALGLFLCNAAILHNSLAADNADDAAAVFACKGRADVAAAVFACRGKADAEAQRHGAKPSPSDACFA